MVAPVKIISISAAILAYITTTFPGYLFLGGTARLKYCSRVTALYCRLALKILGVNVSVKKKSLLPGVRNAMYVSNHMSYIDILIIAARQPTLFITSVEVKHTFFIGLMSALGGSLFVERRSVSGVRKDINRIANLLSGGFNVCFFPEATSTDGSKILPFKSSFFEAAKKAGIAVIPLCIRYALIDKRPADRESLDRVCFYGDMTFFPHFLRLLYVKGIEAELMVSGLISPRSYSRKEMSEVSFHRIKEVYYS